MKRVMKGDNISRSALIRQIEIDADGSPGWYGDTWQFIKTIAKMPSTDAVQVVRCGQCEHWKCNPNTNEYGVCNKVSYDEFEVVMDSDDFCSYGRKKGGDTDAD